MTHRPSRSVFGLSASAVVALACGALPALAQSFTLMGTRPPNYLISQSTALSADGLVAAGHLGSGAASYTWTAAGGRNDFGVGAGSNQALGISGDGGTVVGAASTSPLAFGWTQAAGFHYLGLLPGFQFSSARDASFDGSVIVGTVDNGQGSTPQAFRWTQSGGMQGLGVGTTGEAVSSDGGTIVGTLSSQPIAMRWTASGGVQQLLSLAGTGASHARAVNFDGSIIVGNSGVGLRATMWNNGVPTELLPIIPSSVLTPFGVSDDGSVVAGTIQGPFGNLSAGVWTPTIGTVPLADYLTANGVSVPAGTILKQCTAISSDGKTFAGYTMDQTNGIQGFVATVPAPGLAPALCITGLVAARRRRS